MARSSRVRPPDQAPFLSSSVADRWSAPLGVWAGAPVRLHVSLAVVIVLAAGACVRSGSATGWLVLAAYLVSLSLHETAHVLAASRLRGAAQRRMLSAPLLLGPFGGMTFRCPSIDPRERVFVAMAGPLASLAIVVSAVCCLAAVEGPNVKPLAPSVITEPLTLLHGDVVTTPLGLVAVALVLVNWPLFLVNLAPASPFDGADALRSWGELWMPGRAARDATCAAGLLVAAALLAVGGALALTDLNLPWLGASLAALAVLVGFGAVADANAPATPLAWLPPNDDDYVGASLRDVRVEPATASRYDHDAYHVDEDIDDYSVDRFDETQVDDILAKVHVAGVHSLTANERAILERASQRFQQRRRPLD
ncbi:site-2 protease family protein [Botrimarina mediterranea]|uniref:site-2 protease family protein n=1 Tax=Botrimarina mediterranea TaxID=2528022 RepID=UPI00118849C4|nr:Peptidase family M50 [Planctomycetes bacterium K2D]